MNKKQRPIEIMDTTLRDGEQTSGVSFTAAEKLTLAQLLLEELQVDRIEIASARVSKGEQEAVNRITSWASDKGLLDRIEVLTFVDKGVSLDWMIASGAKVQNLLTKGSLNHLTHQLKQTPEEHFKHVADNLKEAQEKGIRSNVYLEDWSNGMRNSKDYVFAYLDHLVQQPVDRILLPDTLGVLTPDETSAYLREILTRYPKTHFDFHGHNDYDLGVANVLEAVKAGVNGLHLTVNGMGERAGNAALASSIGQRAEQQACEYLTQQGLQLIEKNYRCRSGEIDLIMQQGSENRKQCCPYPTSHLSISSHSSSTIPLSSYCIENKNLQVR